MDGQRFYVAGRSPGAAGRRDAACGDDCGLRGRERTSRSRCPSRTWPARCPFRPAWICFLAARPEVGLSLDEQTPLHRVKADQALALKVEEQKSNGVSTLRMKTVAESGEVVVRWRDLHVFAAGAWLPLTIPMARDSLRCPPPEQPPLRPAMEPVLIRVGLANAGRHRHGAACRHLRCGHRAAASPGRRAAGGPPRARG